MRNKPPYRRTFIREWRKFREMTLEQLAERMDDEMGASALSMLERGQRRYTQESLEQIAKALNTTSAALLSHRPDDSDAIWPIWEAASPSQRAQIAEIAKTLTRARRD